MKTHTKKFGLFIFLISILAINVIATELSYPYPTQDQPLGSGQRHHYAVLLDGEGEAAVAAKLQLTNNGDSPIYVTTLEIPGKQVRIINIVQESIVYQKACKDYQRECIRYEPTVKCISYDGYKCHNYERPCRDYEDKCTGYHDVPGPMQFQRVNYETQRLSESTTVDVSLSSPLQPQQQTALLVYYKAGPYATARLGRFSYDFQTIKVNDDVDYARVAINVPPDYVLAGAQSHTQYRANFGTFAATPEVMMDSAVASEKMSEISRDIEYQQGIVRTGHMLDPFESFHVTGDYAKSTAALYWERIVGIVIAFVAVIVGAVILIRKLLPLRVAIRSSWIIATATGAASAVVISALWLGGFVIIDWLSYYPWGSIELALPLLLVAWIALMFGVVFAPSIVVGIKRGAAWGFATFGTMLVTLFVLGIALVIIGSQLGGF